MENFLLTGTTAGGYDASTPCHKGVLLGFGTTNTPRHSAASWHLGHSCIGDKRCYATATQTLSRGLELSTVTEQFDFKKRASDFTVSTRTPLNVISMGGAQSCVFGAHGAITQMLPVAGWDAVPEVAGWAPRGGADSRFLLFAAPQGKVAFVAANLAGTKLLQALCGPVAHGSPRAPPVYDRNTGGKLWAADSHGNTTVPVTGGGTYSDKFLVQVHEVELHSETAHVTKVICSVFLFSEGEMTLLLESPSSFRGGYFAAGNEGGVTGKTIGHKADTRSVNTARLTERARGQTFSATGQPDSGPLLLAATGSVPTASPFIFIPHTIPCADAKDGSRIVTGIGMPFLVQAAGQLLGPTAGQPHSVHTRDVVMAATKALTVIVAVANSVERGSTPPLGQGARRASRLARTSNIGLAAATGHLVTAAPAVVEWAVGRPLAGDESAFTVLYELKEKMTPLSLPLEQHARRLGFALCALFRAVSPLPTPIPHPDSTRVFTRVAVMEPIATSEIRAVVVLASPLDKHRGTQNKSILLVDQGTASIADWNVLFVDPLARADPHPAPIDGANLRHQLAKAGHDEEVQAVWPLDFCQTSVKLSDPWNCRNVSDTSSYTYFSAELASGVVATLRVACNNRDHAGLPQGRVTRTGDKDQPNPDWKGIEFLYATANQ